MATDWPAALTGLLDVDEAPPEPSPLVGSVRVPDTELPRTATPDGLPVTVVLTGGAGQVAGPASWCRRAGVPLAGLEVALRDLDDPTGNARRFVAAVEAARAEGALAEEVPVYVVLPATDPTYSWLGAADEVAAAELRLAFRAEGVPAPVVAAWLDAALDRELAFRAGGLGVVPLLAGTFAAWDGSPADEVAGILAGGGATLAAGSLDTARRWLVSVSCRSVDAPVAELRSRGLLP